MLTKVKASHEKVLEEMEQLTAKLKEVGGVLNSFYLVVLWYLCIFASDTVLKWGLLGIKPKAFLSGPVANAGEIYVIFATCMHLSGSYANCW